MLEPACGIRHTNSPNPNFLCTRHDPTSLLKENVIPKSILSCHTLRSTLPPPKQIRQPCPAPLHLKRITTRQPTLIDPVSSHPGHVSRAEMVRNRGDIDRKASSAPFHKSSSATVLASGVAGRGAVFLRVIGTEPLLGVPAWFHMSLQRPSVSVTGSAQ
jgi:hypothetical protein